MATRKVAFISICLFWLYALVFFPLRLFIWINVGFFFCLLALGGRLPNKSNKAGRNFYY